MIDREVFIMKGSLSAFAGFGFYMADLVNEITIVLLFIMILDFITGLLRARLTKTLNSTVGLAGIIKKFAMLCILAMTAAIEFLFISIGQDTGGLIMLGVTSFFIVNEGLSVLENGSQMGIPIPPILFNALEKLHRDPAGKEARLERDPNLEWLDKKEIMDENRDLLQRLKKLEQQMAGNHTEAEPPEKI